MRLPELIPDWVLTDWLEPLEPSACSCLHSEPELAEPTPVDPDLVDPELRYPDPELVDPELVDRGPEAAGWAIPGVTWQQPSASPVPVGVTAAVRALQAAAAVVCAIDPTSLSAAQAMSDAEALQDLGQQLRVHGVRRLADVTTRELHTLRGFRSTTAWLRNAQPDADSSDAGLSRRLQGYQRLSTAVEGGELSLVAARKVVLALGRCRLHVDQLDERIDGQPGEQVIAAVVGHVVDLVCGCVLGMGEGDPRLLYLQTATQQIIASGPAGGDPAGSGAGPARTGPAAAGAGQLDRLEAAFVLLAGHVPPSLLTSCLEEWCWPSCRVCWRTGRSAAGTTPACHCSSRTTAPVGAWTLTWTCSAVSGCSRRCAQSSNATRPSGWTPRPRLRCGRRASTRGIPTPVRSGRLAVGTVRLAVRAEWTSRTGLRSARWTGRGRAGSGCTTRSTRCSAVTSSTAWAAAARRCRCRSTSRSALR